MGQQVNALSICLEDPLSMSPPTSPIPKRKIPSLPLYNLENVHSLVLSLSNHLFILYNYLARCVVLIAIQDANSDGN
ncbi:hypothetical protein JHK82_032984 [Glycine max]|uniref:Uncharacterized protein n=1 Tax=Glycine max TaxID=3847 RepID=K7LTC9_SOYBN|nr:hypothetical protein JHK87_032924 [Glycine soja]KAG4979731.1 hypothetical protein JHK85_033689 [Glycine max]KAG4985382.1 hypothetical protein JHK86_033073 [Glycine max]KAG5118564.1 hypothetical protein JHK82_032984 [Glycine max]KAG5139552.1 hypothetical protein JHK84_033320 [Glycine max]